jgi:hypothetical protein
MRSSTFQPRRAASATFAWIGAKLYTPSAGSSCFHIAHIAKTGVTVKGIVVVGGRAMADGPPKGISLSGHWLFHVLGGMGT